jgi:hypothetical protein
LQKMVGITRAKNLVMRSRRIAGCQACDWGIATDCVPDPGLEAATDALVNELRGFSALAQRTAKKLLNDIEDAPLSLAVEIEGQCYGRLRSSEDFREASKPSPPSGSSIFVGDDASLGRLARRIGPPVRALEACFARLLFHIHQPAQHFAAAREARPDGADRNIEHDRNLLITHPFETNEQNDLPLLLGEKTDHPLEVAQLQRRLSTRRHGQDRHDVFQRDGNALPYRAADVVDVLVMEDREQPSAQIGARQPEMFLGNRANQAALHQIVGARRIPGQRPCVAPQPWDFFFEKLSKITHRRTFAGCSLDHRPRPRDRRAV